MRAFFLGIVATLAVFAIGAFVVVQFGLIRVGADVKPPALEKISAKQALGAAIARESTAYHNPLQPTTANLAAGVALYGANCAICHGAADAKASILAKGFYIEAPQLAKHGVEDDPEADTYWKLVHGIRFSAMPAFGANLSSDDLWRLTIFLKHMDALPPPVEKAWRRVPSATATPRAA